MHNYSCYRRLINSNQMNIIIDIYMAATEAEIGIEYCAHFEQKNMQHRSGHSHLHRCDDIAGQAINRTPHDRHISTRKF